MENQNNFELMYNRDMSAKLKTKGGLKYLSWAAAWAEVKKLFPDATYRIYEENIKIIKTVGDTIIERNVPRPWFDDGHTGWVKTGVTINGIEHIEDLPIMDFKNKSMAADAITSMDANKAIQRSLTKACGRHGCALWIYEGEDLPEETRKVELLREECFNLFKERAKISEDAKIKCNELCKEADPSGDPRLIDDVSVLEELKKKLIAVRK